jgi:hypothetical protein
LVVVVVAVVEMVMVFVFVLMVAVFVVVVETVAMLVCAGVLASGPLRERLDIRGTAI